MAWLSLVFWPLATVLMAVGQGLLLPSLRSRVPPQGWEARQVDTALHKVLLLAYFAPLLLAPTTWLLALLSRMLLFDPVINLATGYPVFDVAQTSSTDKAIRWAAKRLNWAPEHLRALLWAVALLGTLLAFGWRLIK